MDIFNACHDINAQLINGNESLARDQLIILLDLLEKENISYPDIVNHLVRQLGLYPYINPETSSWQDRFVYESFKVDVGSSEPLTLHREQSSILNKLLNGQSLAISAPTSFGKSFVIDSYISITKPKNIMIIVPTIALTDETRRRLHQKFSKKYKIITTPDCSLSEFNIFVFPQERAIHYIDKLDSIDMLVVDEFYKASKSFDKERAPSLIKAIIELESKAKQKYFLAPHISTLNQNPFTQGMEFISLDFNTVYLKKHDLYLTINNEETKGNELLRILSENKGKTLIYAGTYSNITRVSNLLISHTNTRDNYLLNIFHDWLSKNYDANWQLTNLIKRGAGIHNGQLHRSLSQIQVKLFEENDGLNYIISTSSIIEGVNTSAENVVIWKNKNGTSKLNDFTFRNIIGRGGRMFRHFVGNIFILEPPPSTEETQLNLMLPDEITPSIDPDTYKHELTNDQIEKIIYYREQMSEIFGTDRYNELIKTKTLQIVDSELTIKIAQNVNNNIHDWHGIGYLNSSNPSDWDYYLYKLINFQPGAWGIEYNKFVSFIKILSRNWELDIPDMLSELDDYDIGIDDFFKLERTVTYKFASLAGDVNTIQLELLKNDATDISPFVSKLSHAFLPSTVYQLEEYGLPRMISKKIHRSGLLDFEDNEIELHDTIHTLNHIGLETLLFNVRNLDNFDRYILTYFYDGITPN